MDDLTFKPSLSDFSISVPRLSSISEGYVYSGMNENGGYKATPDPYAFNNIKHFSTSLAYPELPTFNSETVRYLNTEYYSTLNSMGVTTDPRKGDNFRPIGVDTAGQMLYSAQSMSASEDYQLGSKAIRGSVGMLQGFSVALDAPVFDESELQKFDNISAVSSDQGVISELNTLRAANDSEGFIDKITGLLFPEKPGVTNKAKANGKGAKGDEDSAGILDMLGNAYDAYALFETWDLISPAQKSLGVASLGVKGYDYLTTGAKLGDKVLVNATLKADGTELTPALTVTESLQLFDVGINAYSLAKNWDQLSDLGKIANGLRTVKSIVNVAQTHNLLGFGTAGAAVPNISAGALAQAGFSATPQFGIGAIMGPSTSALPAGYTAVAYTGAGTSGAVAAAGPIPEMGTAAYDAMAGSNIIAVPEANLSSAAGVQSTAGSMLNTAVGVAGVAYGAYSIIDGWGQGGKEGAINGAMGGVSMAAGLYALGATNPFLMAGVVAFAALSGLIKTGKHEDQVARDSVRDNFKRIGVMGDDNNITLADGTKADLGRDGDSGRHDWYDVDKAKQSGAGERANGKLYAYDVDYTNDTAYMSSLGGVALSRLVNGGTAKNVDQMGGQLANAFISNVDINGELTEEKFNKVMANQRAFAAQIGLKSKGAAYILANQLYGDGRINEFEHTQMLQAFNMMYDADAWNYAQTLMEGRWNGVSAANEKQDIPSKDKVKVERKQTKAEKENQEAIV